MPLETNAPNVDRPALYCRLSVVGGGRLGTLDAVAVVATGGGEQTNLFRPIR